MDLLTESNGQGRAISELQRLRRHRLDSPYSVWAWEGQCRSCSLRFVCSTLTSSALRPRLAAYRGDASLMANQQRSTETTDPRTIACVARCRKGELRPR